jgi:hypothetical protein
MRLQRMAEHQIPAAKIARRLHRTEAAVRSEARKQRVMLAPTERQLSLTDKRPYGGLRVEPRRSAARSKPVPPREQMRDDRPAQSETLF